VHPLCALINGIKVEMLKTQRIAAALLISLSHQYSQAEGTQKQEAFQGLAWGATESQIEEKFRGKIKKEECTDDGKVFAAKLGEACDNPKMSDYRVVDIPFTVSFSIDAKNRSLTRVHLTFFGPIPLQGKIEDARLEWKMKHEALKDALTNRYGAPEATDVITTGKTLGQIATWRTSSSVIELTSAFRSYEATLASEEYAIRYRPRLTKDSLKL
jgi:hypothetical protein